MGNRCLLTCCVAPHPPRAGVSRSWVSSHRQSINAKHEGQRNSTRTSRLQRSPLKCDCSPCAATQTSRSSVFCLSFPSHFRHGCSVNPCRACRAAMSVASCTSKSTE